MKKKEKGRLPKEIRTKMTSSIQMMTNNGPITGLSYQWQASIHYNLSSKETGRDLSILYFKLIKKVYRR